jgi:hypothetical protein
VANDARLQAERAHRLFVSLLERFSEAWQVKRMMLVEKNPAAGTAGPIGIILPT